MATHTPSQRAHGLGVVTAVGDLGNLSSSSSGGVESPPLMDPHHGDSLLFLRGIPNVEQWWDQLGSQDDYEDMVDELADLACVDDSDSGISEVWGREGGVYLCMYVIFLSVRVSVCTKV